MQTILSNLEPLQASDGAGLGIWNLRSKNELRGLDAESLAVPSLGKPSWDLGVRQNPTMPGQLRRRAQL